MSKASSTQSQSQMQSHDQAQSQNQTQSQDQAQSLNQAQRQDQTIENRRPLFISIAIICCLLSACVIVLFLNSKKQASGGIAYISQNGEIIQTIDLSLVEENEPYTLTIESSDGGSNTIEVRHNEIGIVDASCPDHICISTGFIHDSSIPIVCLPNALVIEVKAADSSGSGLTKFDSVAR